MENINRLQLLTREKSSLADVIPPLEVSKFPDSFLSAFRTALPRDFGTEAGVVLLRLTVAKQHNKNRLRFSNHRLCKCCLTSFTVLHVEYLPCGCAETEAGSKVSSRQLTAPSTVIYT
jgi:hypothetical protein